METANAFDMLVLPVLQWFAGIFATLPILHGIRFALGRLFGNDEPPVDFVERSARPASR